MNCGYLTLAFCAVFWYWSNPGDHKRPQAGVSKGACWAVRYHFGTVVFGSLLVAVVQIARVCVEIFEEKMRDCVGTDNKAAGCMINCIKCCLACFERFLKFVNKNAYIMTAMTSDSFCSGAMRAMFLLLKNARRVMAVTVIGEWVIFFGKLQAVCLTTALSWFLLTKTSFRGEEDAGDSFLVLIAVAVMSFIVASIFCEVFGVCVDTVLLSFCYDLDINNGQDKPYYLPGDLQDSLDAHNSGSRELSSKEQPMMSTAY